MSCVAIAGALFIAPVPSSRYATWCSVCLLAETPEAGRRLKSLLLEPAEAVTEAN